MTRERLRTLLHSRPQLPVLLAAAGAVTLVAGLVVSAGPTTASGEPARVLAAPERAGEVNAGELGLVDRVLSPRGKNRRESDPPSPSPTPTPAPTTAPPAGPVLDQTLHHPDLGVVRLSLETTSSWATAYINFVSFRASRMEGSSALAGVQTGHTGFMLQSVAPSWGHMLAVVDAPAGSEPMLRVRKGTGGTATARVVRLSDGVVLAERSLGAGSTDEFVTFSRESLVGEGITLQRRDPRRLVLAFYYPWWWTGRFDSGWWPDTPAGEYDSFDIDSVRTMTAQARASGIDAFVVSFSGNGAHTYGFDLALQAARERGDFQVAPILEFDTVNEGLPFTDLNALEAMARAALQRAADPAFLKVDGRPVLYTFGIWRLTPSQFSTLRSRLESAGNPFWIGDSKTTAYNVDGAYMYSPNGRSPAALAAEYRAASDAQRLDQFVAPGVGQRLWAGTVSPGYDDRHTRPMNSLVEDRLDGLRYEQTWDVAGIDRPEWITVTSWNEWNEQSHVQPSLVAGSRALDQTAARSADFKSR